MATNTEVRAAIYCRISNDKTGQRAGVERQERECRELADRLGWHVAAIYCDNDISAYNGKRRPDYETLLTDMEAGRIGAVIAWHPDRLHRRPVELERYIDICDKHRVLNHTVQTGLWDLSTPSGRLTARQLGAVARFESEHKAERVKAAKHDMAREGRWHGGIRCFGYEPDGVTVRESEAAEIRKAAQGVVSGVSLRSLARDMNLRGVATVTGRRPWSSAHLRSVLIRPRLAGLRAYHGQVIREGAWPAILDRSTWEAVKAVLDDPKRNTGGSGRRGRTPTSLGTRLYVCGVCGEAALRVGSSKVRGRVYRCSSEEPSGSARRHVCRDAAALDAFVEGALLEKLSEPGAVEAIAAAVGTDADADLVALRNEQETIRPRLNKAAMRYEAGEIDDEQLAIISKGLHARDADITAILSAANMRSPLDVLMGVENIETCWDTMLSMGEKRAILAEVLRVTVLPVAGGRVAGGGYFDSAGVRIDLTDRARSALSS